ncbi:MAG: hypothetical protein JRJ79_17935, partial [Deltaproteobacteria bacterium]|nr:hypothetical protein [Deltaproteobacteria bacterium]
MSKTLNNNTKEYNPTMSVAEVYKDLFTLRQKPISDAFIDRLALELIEWAMKDDTALKLTQFIFSKGIPSMTFYRWVNKYETLKLVKDTALELIGNRREIGALKNKLNASLVMNQMAKYDKSWKDLEVWRAELKARTQVNAPTDTRYTFVLEDFSKKDDTKTINLP